jgi:hypothetical protein
MKISGKAVDFFKNLWEKGNNSEPPKEYYGWINVDRQIKYHVISSFKKDQYENLCRPKFNGENFPGQYIFHVHPSNDNHIFEFPSSNDIFNFMYLHNKRKLKQSIIIAPEGFYSITSLNNKLKYYLDHNVYKKLDRIIEYIYHSEEHHNELLKKLNIRLNKLNVKVDFSINNLDLY